ncbi:MAG: M20/M25/M40 family metallo-hydrolase [Bdellovibrionota bacterium]
MHLPPMDWMVEAIRIPSLTYEGNEEIVRFLVPLLEDCGLKVREQRVQENGQTFINLIAFSHAPDSPDLLAFHTHLDTVSFGEKEDWTKTGGDPFKLTRVRDRLYGLGSADVKLDFLCKIWAAKHAGPWGRPIALIGSYGEERGLIGAQKLLEAHQVRPQYTLVGEPSELSLVFAHKGHMVYTLRLALSPSGQSPKEKSWKGKAAHSSTPHLGVNALNKGLTDVFKRGLGIVSLEAGTDTNRIPDRCTARVVESQTAATTSLFHLFHYFEELNHDFKKRRDNRFNPASSTLSANRVETRDGALYLSFDVRGLPDLDLYRLQKKIESQVKEWGFETASFSIDAPLKGRRDSPFMRLASQNLKTAGHKKIVKATKASSTEAALYQQHGSEAIVFGPGISTGNVHRPNEYNSLSQIKIATRFYTEMMRSRPGAEQDH